MKLSRYWIIVLPLFIFLGWLFFYPLGVTFLNTVIGPNGRFTASSYVNFFSDPFYLKIVARTISLGLLITLISVIMGYPVAYFLTFHAGHWKNLLLALVLFPLLTNAVVRSFSWMVMLGKYGLINNLLRFMHLITQPIKILYTPSAVIIGLTHLFLPLMIISLVSAMENLNIDLIEVAESLGANYFKIFFKIILPLTTPGLVVGSVLVFTGSITAYVTPQLLGGSRVMVLSTLIYQKAMVAFKLNDATVIAGISTLITILSIVIFQTIAKKMGGKA